MTQAVLERAERRFFPALAWARLDRYEIAGSLGDLGTFLPLLVGMASQNGLDFGAGLFFAGLFNLITGLVFPIPMAVQPMKAIAAVAITERLSVSEIVAAGAIVSAVVLLLGVTRLIDWVNRIIPTAVVRGLNISAGANTGITGSGATSLSTSEVSVTTSRIWDVASSQPLLEQRYLPMSKHSYKILR